MKPCCLLRRTIRYWRGELGPLFTCDKCGTAYRKHDGIWQEVSVADEITDMMRETQ